MKKRIAALTLILVFIFSLVSCSKGASSFDSVSMEANGLYPSEDFALDEAEPYYAEKRTYGSSMSESGFEKTEAPKNDVAERKIIKNANLTFQTKEFDGFIESFKHMINNYGGYVESSDIYGGGAMDSRYSRSANITVRIPADCYEKFMETVVTLGSLTHSNEYINDVTLTYVDIESRIDAYETEYNALMELLAKAESVDAIIQLRNRISDIQYQLESYKSQIRKYDDLISYCTVRMYVEEVKVVTVSEDKLTVGERIKIGFAETIEEIKEDAEDFAVWFVVNIPHIIIDLAIVAVIIIVIVVAVKTSGKKKQKKASQKPAEEKTDNEEETK